MDLLKFLGTFDVDLFKLMNVCKEFNVSQIINSPTRVNALLDHIYVNKKALYSNHGNFSIRNSDHDMVYVIRKARKFKSAPKVIMTRNLKNCDWESFRKEISAIEIKTEGCSNPDNIYQDFNLNMLELLDKFAPPTKRLVKNRPSPWYTANLANLRKTRNFLDRKFKADKLPESRKLYQKARNEYNCELKQAKSRYFSNVLQKCQTAGQDSTRQFWNKVDELTNFRMKSSKEVTILVDSSNIKITDKKAIHSELANAFVVKPENEVYPSFDEIYFSTVSERESTSVMDSYKDECAMESESEDLVITPNDVKVAIEELDVKKGNNEPFSIPTRVLKKIVILISKQLAVLFMFFIRILSLPVAFKSARVVPLFKGKGSVQIPTNYRPVSILGSVTKIFDRVLYNKLFDSIEERLCEQQHGFRKKRSTHTALTIFSDYIFTGTDKRNGKVVAVYIDMKKAFDSVSPKLLIQKLMSEFSIGKTLLAMLYAFLTGRVFKIGESGQYFPNFLGIPQGSVVGPLMFSAFINDLGQYLNIPFLLYCDDIVLYYEGTDIDELVDLAKHELEQVDKWCIENEMKMNYDKTKFMIFSKTPKTYENKYSNFKCNNFVIERVSNFKYLGVVFEENLKFDIHFENVKKRVRQRISYLYGIKKYLNEFAVKVLVNAYVHSILDYCVDVWSSQTAAKIQSVQDIINRFIISFSVPKYAKMWNKKNFDIVRKKINVNDLLVCYNFMTFDERISLALAKNMYWKVKRDSVVKLDKYEKSMPLIKVPAHNSHAYTRSSFYRGIMMFNKLPRDWNFDIMSFGYFIKYVKSWLIEQRTTL